MYQDHLTKFVILRPLRRKTAAEVASTLLDIFCLLGPPHILQSDNGKEFKNINLAVMIRDLWPGCTIVNGKSSESRISGKGKSGDQEGVGCFDAKE